MINAAEKPWLFLDIDGVLIPGGTVFDAAGIDSGEHPLPAIAHGASSVDVKHPHFGIVRAFIPDRIAAMVPELDKVYDIVWMSTWGNLARDLESMLGIAPEHCVVPRQRMDGSVLKGDAVEEFLSGYDRDDDDAEPEHRRRRFAWVDDQLSKFTWEVGEYTRHHSLDWMGITTVEAVGLTAAHTAALIAFAQSE